VARHGRALAARVVSRRLALAARRRPFVDANLHATPHEDIGAALLELGVALDARPCAAHVKLARRAARAEPPPEFAFASLSGFTKFKAPLD
jgi:hypothetical protein